MVVGNPREATEERINNLDGMRFRFKGERKKGTIRVININRLSRHIRIGVDIGGGTRYCRPKHLDFIKNLIEE